MGSFQRATIPAEFLDVTSAELLLPAEPEYFHANIVLNAVKVRVDFGGSWGLPIPGRQLTGGAAGYAQLDEMLQKLVGLPDPVYSEAIMVTPDWMKKGVGHTIRFNRPKFDESTYTKASRRVPTGATINQNPITVGSDQATVTVERLAGPYSNVDNQVHPYGLERFDFDRSIHDPNAIKDLHISRDFRKTIDTVGVQLFDQGTAIYPVGMTADDDALTAGAFPMSYEYLTLVILSLVSGNVPRFRNARWMCVLTPLQMQQLSVDPQYLKLVRYDPDINPIYKPNYRGTVGALDIFESNTLTTVDNSSGVPIQYGQAFGPKSVGWGMTEMPRTASNSNDNFGESPSVVWFWYCGSDVLNSDFQRRLATS
jgi:hypothetical protein